MSPAVCAEQRFRSWHLPWKEQVCDEVKHFSHGAVLRSPRHPDFWEYNCVRLERPMEASEMVAVCDPVIFMLHDGRAVPAGDAELAEADYDAVRELRDIWLREDFGERIETEAFHRQAREVAELADVRVIATLQEGRPTGFAQVETHDGGSEVTQVFVRSEHRGAGLGAALTARAIRIAAGAAPDVWICAERDDRPRRLYERLGFRPVVEAGVAILPPKP